MITKSKLSILLLFSIFNLHSMHFRNVIHKAITRSHHLNVPMYQRYNLPKFCTNSENKVELERKIELISNSLAVQLKELTQRKKYVVIARAFIGNINFLTFKIGHALGVLGISSLLSASGREHFIGLACMSYAVGGVFHSFDSEEANKEEKLENLIKNIKNDIDVLEKVRNKSN